MNWFEMVFFLIDNCFTIVSHRLIRKSTILTIHHLCHLIMQKWQTFAGPASQM